MSSFLDNLLGARGCNVDGTTTNNPLMRLTDQLMESFLTPAITTEEHLSGVRRSELQQQGRSSYEQGTLVVRESSSIPSTSTAPDRAALVSADS